MDNTDPFAAYLSGNALLNGTADGSATFDTNAGVNLPAAQATVPVIANSAGTSSTSAPWYATLFGSITNTAGQVFTAQNTAANNLNATNTKTVAAANTSIAASTYMWIALAVVGIAGIVVFARRR